VRTSGTCVWRGSEKSAPLYVARKTPTDRQWRFLICRPTVRILQWHRHGGCAARSSLRWRREQDIAPLRERTRHGLDPAADFTLSFALVGRPHTITMEPNYAENQGVSVGQPTRANGPAELTIRGLIIGVVITLVFTAANVYFGLKAGLTFSTSIPAAVISMAILRGFRDATVQENNIVQTVASAAGTLSSIIFVLPGLIMIGWWTGFPFWISFLICALGGILGVMYSIPLRRALVTNSDLPYPEGVACAEMLKVGSGDKANASEVEQGRAGLLAVLWGSIVSAAFAVIVATQLFAADVAQTFRIRRDAVSGYDFNLSFALFGVGHLVGLSVGIAMLVGAIIGWGWGVPYYAQVATDLIHSGVALPTTKAFQALIKAVNSGEAPAIAQQTWSNYVRYIGAGAIGASAIWTLLKLVQPVVRGLASAMAASRARKAGKSATLPITERDIPIGIVGLVTLVCMLPIAWVLGFFANSGGLGAHVTTLVVGGVFYIFLMSFFVSTVCGYMAGLIGSSNSPLSGIGILVVIGATLLLAFGVKPYVPIEAYKAL